MANSALSTALGECPVCVYLIALARSDVLYLGELVYLAIHLQIILETTSLCIQVLHKPTNYVRDSSISGMAKLTELAGRV
ncbi:MAG: hypothetical protein OQK46_10270 [Gammaproteobacteria bacterium]|nr:hypothetical protein [Gammaproteobacteria bacterium]